MNQTNTSARTNRTLPTRFAAGLALSASLAVAAPAFALDPGIYTLQQASSLRFMDAHENDANDFDSVTRGEQANNTQEWLILPVPNTADRYTLQQLSNLRFLDAHESAVNDFRAVTREQQSNATQRWIITELRNGSYRIQQESNRRFLDAHEDSGPDFSIVTRDFQANNTQEWIIE